MDIAYHGTCTIEIALWKGVLGIDSLAESISTRTGCDGVAGIHAGNLSVFIVDGTVHSIPGRSVASGIGGIVICLQLIDERCPRFPGMNA